MKELVIIILFLTILTINVVSAQTPVDCTYGEGTYGSGAYGIGDCTIPEEVEEGIGITRPGAGAIVNYTVPQQEEFIKQQLLSSICPPSPTFTTRLTSKCKLPENGICDDGENLLIDDDCKLTWEGIKTGKLLKDMWFLRFVFLLSIFLLVRDSKSYPSITAILILLLVYNGAFITPGIEYDAVKCMDINFLINFGYCVMPDKPLMGWIIGFMIIILFINYLTKDKDKGKKAEKKEKQKEQPKLRNAILVFILALMMLYIGVMMQERGIGFDKSKCTDVGFLINFGECVMPSKPIFGWLIGVALVALLLAYLFQDEIRKPKKPKTI